MQLNPSEISELIKKRIEGYVNVSISNLSSTEIKRTYEQP